MSNPSIGSHVPGQPTGVPVDYSGLISQKPSEKKVQQGPGGTSQVVTTPQDTTIQATRDDYVPGSQIPTTVLTSDPFLDHPRDVGHHTIAFATTFLGVFMSFIAQQLEVTDTSSSGGAPSDEFSFTPKGDIGEMTLEQLFEAAIEGPQTGGSTSGTTQAQASSGQTILDNLSSSDPSVVLEQLKTICNFQSGDEGTLSLLTSLAGKIAEGNAAGNSITSLTSDSTLQDALNALSSGISDQDPESMKSLLGKITQSIISSQSEVASGTPTTTTFASFMLKLLGLTPSTPPPISHETQEVLNGMASSDASSVEKTLLSFVDLNALNLTPDQKALVESKIKDLANSIALANFTGGAWPLQSTLSAVVLAGLIGPLNLSDEQKAVVSPILATIAEKIAGANDESLTHTPEMSQEYADLTSLDSSKLSALFSSMLDPTTLPTGIDPEAMKNVLSQLATALATSGVDIASVDPAAVKSILTKALGDLVASGAISAEDSAAFTQSVLPSVVTNITDITGDQASAMIRSGDPETIKKGLTIAIGGTDDLPPADQAAVGDYLSALTQALAFIAVIRAEITKLQGQFTQELANAKLSQIGDQIQQAVANATKELEKIAKTQRKSLHQLKKAKFMRIFMPLIMLIVTYIMTIVTVVSIIGAPFTGGASAIASIAATAALITALACTMTAMVITVADACCTWSTGKGMMQTICDKAGIKDPALQALVNLAVNMTVIIITTICTLGVGATMIPGKLAQIAVETGEEVGMSVAKEIIASSLKACVSGVMGRVIVSTLIGTLFSSGIVMAGLTKLIKLFCKDEMTAMIVAMVLNIAMMLAAIAIVMKALPSGAKAAGTSVSDAAKSAGRSSITIGAERAAGSGISGAVSVTSDSLEQIAKQSQIMTMLKKLIETLKHGLMSGQILQIIEALSQLLQMVQGIVMATMSIQTGMLQKQLAKIEGELAALEAAYTFMKDLSKMGPEATIEKLNESSKEMHEDWSKLVDLVAGFIQGAMQNMDKLANQGAYSPR
jgi:hypothetical protein